MINHTNKEAENKRQKIQLFYWNKVGAVEHVSVRMVEDAIRREFKDEDGRFIESQLELMRTEGRIRVQSRVKVWINQP